MAGNYWIKFYCEILDDPKMATLPDRLWRRFYELCLLAGKQNKDGEIPPVNQIAWSLRMTEIELHQDIDALITTGLITATDTGFIVTNFSKRQEKATNAERVAHYREAKHKGEYYGNENVTQMKRNVTQITDNRYREQITDKETDADVDGGSLLATFTELYPGMQPRANTDQWADALSRMQLAGVTPAIMRRAARELADKQMKVASPGSLVNPCLMVMQKDPPRKSNSEGAFKDAVIT